MTRRDRTLHVTGVARWLHVICNIFRIWYRLVVSHVVVCLTEVLARGNHLGLKRHFECLTHLIIHEEGCPFHFLRSMICDLVELRR